MSDIASAASAQRVQAGSGKDMPLTAEIKDRLETHLSAVNRIYSTIYQLRDRLLGTPPGNPAGVTDAPPPYAFSDAVRGLNSDLSYRLQELEELAEGLAIRL